MDLGYDEDKRSAECLAKPSANATGDVHKSVKQYKIGRNKSYLKERLFRDKLKAEND